MKRKNKKYLVVPGIIVLLCFTIGIVMAQSNQDTKSKDIVDDIKPYDGSIGPGNVLYGLKIAFENIGESFTFNETEKIEKHVEHAELRLAEAKGELEKNNKEAANKALDLYREKIQATDDRITGIDRSEPGLVTAQEKIIKHELVLRRLSESQPDNRGLSTALNNSLRLEEKFELRTKVKLEREVGEDRDRVRVREVEIEEKEIQTEIEDNAAKVKVKVKFIADSTDPEIIKKEILEKIKLGRDDVIRLVGETEVSPTGTATETPEVTGTRGATATATVTGTPRTTPRVTGTPEATGTPEVELPEGRLKVRVESGRSVSEVEVELRFTVNAVNRDAIVQEIEQKLAALSLDDVQRVEIEIRERREDRREDRQGDRREDRRGEGSGREAESGRGGAGESGDDRGGRSGGASGGGGDDSGGSGSSSGGDSGGGSGSGGGGGGGGGGGK